ncbi:hypothetical protein ACN28C_29025 [Plantactinospora sp. WMMC1484]|uniref:hypothetical protein n=1 Tax=Plantactinospora sp. WMMC1484 TaxID=3404122 RepID=UPI003BF4EC5D
MSRTGAEATSRYPPLHAPDAPEATRTAERADRHRPPNLGPVLRRLPSRRSL